MTFRRRAANEDGIALITALLVMAILSSLVIVTVTVTVHSNDVTQNDARREAAFGAATAGVDDALRCLQQLNPVNPVTTCNMTAGSVTAGGGTTLTDAGHTIGQYEVALTDLTPGATTKTVDIVSNGWGNTKTAVSAARTNRTVSARVTLTPVGGFFDAIFAGGASPNGLVSFKNNATITGSVYARTYDVQKNNNSLTDLRIVGDITTQNEDVYHSVWAGGNLTMTNNTVVQTSAQACGANGSAGDATLSNGSHVGGNLRYKGTYNNGGTVGSLTHAGCSAPPAIGLPTFTYSAADYLGWTIITFTSVATANACLATQGSTLAAQSAACGGQTLGDANGTVGKNVAGTLVYVNATTCAPLGVQTPVLFTGGTFAGNFTIVTNCKLQPAGTFMLSASATGSKQAVFISTSSTGADDLSAAITSGSTGLSVLLYTAGELSTKNNLSIASGAMYGASVNGKNNVTMATSSDLANHPPAGFTFDPVVSTSYIPTVILWRES